MRAFSLPIIVSAAALLAGCSFEPKYERPALPVAAHFPTGPAYRAEPASGAQALPAADIGWRDFFGEPRLRKLIELALANNRDLRVSALRVQEAAAQYRIVRAGLFPNVNATAGQSKSRVPEDLSSSGQTITNVYSVGLGAASWELDFWGRVRSLKAQALAQYLATAQARKAAAISLVSQVADQYLAVLAYDEQLKITRETLRTADASYKLAKLKFDVGAGSELDLREAEGVAEQARANLAVQMRLRAQAENALILVVGEPLPADLPPSLGLDDQRILADVPAGLPSDLLTRRPDIIQAEQTLRAANANIGAARAAFFPRIALTGQFGTESASLGGLFKAGSAAWSFAPQITLPIFDAGTNLARLDVAHLEKNVAIAQYEKAIQTAFREVSDGLAARGTYDNQIASLQRFVATQQRRLDLSNLLYKNGASSYLTVLTAQTDLYTAQQTLITARMQRLANLVDLYQYLGGGWIEHTGDTPLPADAGS
ncbi:efflux transporter outer membrane subunit [Paralcaligenes sp. KSB-10]|uniref:efflux transporter outer membrane subunit n=1 Tax=Paralcaligenes sp. KSB-10 TaxID=2901142 RepID=UPI001E457A94|nr:efflux transporter outer membrane subunit [Paralcaligenes sp. KSB-10]UHL65997.1 efflux transporter outer membrane subunit [Paralcaligenes sp. KSB-10]